MGNDIDLTVENKFLELRTAAEDEFDELNFEGLKYDTSSDTFHDLEIDVINNTTEHDSIVELVVVEHDMFYKRFRCKYKETR